MTLKVKYADFEQATRSRSKPGPLYGKAEFLSVVEGLLAQSFPSATPVRLLGVTVSNFVKAPDAQDGYYSAVLPIMEGPSWSAAAVYVNAAGETEKSTIWLSPKAVELMKPLAVFVDCDGPNPNEVELFLGAGDDFDPITVEMPDDLRPQVLYPAVISHWIAQEIIEMEHAMSDGTMEIVAEFALSA